jgi:hypothetical protein
VTQTYVLRSLLPVSVRRALVDDPADDQVGGQRAVGACSGVPAAGRVRVVAAAAAAVLTQLAPARAAFNLRRRRASRWWCSR